MKITAGRAAAGILLLLICFSMLGCYTVIRRSGAGIDEQDRYLSEGRLSERWIDPGHLWYDPFYHWYYPSAYGHWRYYYTYPWWWNDYWFWDPGPDRPAAPVDTDRHIWDERRRPGWSSPPSSPAPPSSASRPKRSPKKEESDRSSGDSSQQNQRRTPNWDQGNKDNSGYDLEKKRRQGDEGGGSDGN
jgi:hypothetical protein